MTSLTKQLDEALETDRHALTTVNEGSIIHIGVTSSILRILQDYNRRLKMLEEKVQP